MLHYVIGDVDQYMSSRFYDVSGFTLKERAALLEQAKELCYEWWVDELDCSKSYARIRKNMPFSEILKKLTTTSLFTIVHRDERGLCSESEYYEFGFTTMGNEVNYYLWIKVSLDKGHELVNNLKLRGV